VDEVLLDNLERLMGARQTPGGGACEFKGFQFRPDLVQLGAYALKQNRKPSLLCCSPPFKACNPSSHRGDSLVP